MAPPEFYIELRQGITALTPPIPLAIHTLVRSKDDPSHIIVNSAVRPDDQPSMGEAQMKKLDVEPHSHLIDELESILSSIPTESPPGNEDIYGMDIGIQYGSMNIQWANGGLAGCGQDESEEQPTAEQKMKFRRAVEVINELISQHA